MLTKLLLVIVVYITILKNDFGNFLNFLIENIDNFFVIIAETANEQKCMAWGEPHIKTWATNTSNHSYYCLIAGEQTLMENEWIRFIIKIQSGYIVGVCFYYC